MKKRSRFGALIKTIVYTILTLGLYLLFGKRLNKFLLSPKAAEGGYASQPLEDFISGTPSDPAMQAYLTVHSSLLLKQTQSGIQT